MCQFCNANPEEPCVECKRKVCIERREICAGCGKWICPDCLIPRSISAWCETCWKMRMDRYRKSLKEAVCQTKI